jgi:hypothetical protein
MRIAAAALLIAACLTGAAPASAQQPGGRIRAVTATAAPVYVLPDAERTPLRTLPPGTRLRVLREQGDWLRVEFDDPWWGPRVGYIERKLVEITEDDEPARPRDAAPIQPTPAPKRRARPAPRLDRVWIDVNGGVAMAGERDYSAVGIRQINGQDATFQADYHLPAGPVFEVGGGVLITGMVGVGATLAGSVQEDTAALTIDIPHPILAGANAGAEGETSRELRRRESSLHIHGTIVSQPSPELRTRVFAGPTYFRLEQDVVQTIVYSQNFLPFEPAHEVEITSASILRIPYDEATGWGFHVGADAAWFFTRGLGLGGFGRYSRGTIEIQDPLTGGAMELVVGGFQAGAGLRVKF